MSQDAVTFIVDDSTGNAVYLVTEAAASLELGAQPQRASHVIPRNFALRGLFYLLRYWLGDKGRMSDLTRLWKCEWIVDTRPVGGPILSTVYYDRKQAINAEVAYLNQLFIWRIV
jgi:hypothetical protein